ncbi:MAG: hypothetical protein D6746_16700 [Bacteroidetes bacterium]|nr:MAG: hypothetical protein D6746_16700 [Bacteroidota bacterium]
MDKPTLVNVLRQYDLLPEDADVEDDEQALSTLASGLLEFAVSSMPPEKQVLFFAALGAPDYAIFKAQLAGDDEQMLESYYATQLGDEAKAKALVDNIKESGQLEAEVAKVRKKVEEEFRLKTQQLGQSFAKTAKAPQPAEPKRIDEETLSKSNEKIEFFLNKEPVAKTIQQRVDGDIVVDKLDKMLSDPSALAFLRIMAAFYSEKEGLKADKMMTFFGRKSLSMKSSPGGTHSAPQAKKPLDAESILKSLLHATEKIE